MLKVSSIKNVQNTINNKKVSFKAGVQSNYGADVINNTSSKNETSFLTDFLGTIKQSPLFYETFMKRQLSIENGLNVENKINTIV
ncbi:MAG: hypothetical protein IKU37_03365 [Candidatus Gastranaerophilales bacterium]|nr:hypothetical protein [Candidatus Gastranaerophilales bacterium]